MHSAIREALAQSPSALSIVGAKTGMTVLLAFNPDRTFPAWVAKVGSGTQMTALLARERNALELVAPHAARLGAPKILTWSEAGSPCLIFTGVEGFSVHFGLHAETGSSRDARCLSAALEWLKVFRTSLPGAEIERKLGPVDDRTWLERESGKDPALKRMLEVIKSAGELQQEAAHGDFWCGNLIFHDGALAVIDWEGLSVRHPLHDVLSLLTHCSYRSGSRVELDLSPNRFLELYFSNSVASRFVQTTVTGIESNTARLRAAFYSFITHSLRHKGGRYREAWLEILRALDQRGFPAPWSR